MIRHAFIFLGTFIAGALVALGIRAAAFNPHAEHAPAAVVASPAAGSSADPHAGHVAAPSPESTKPVNTVCAICGMNVDPSLPTLEYRGKKIGFGCQLCPPKFKADPDKYGPYYLRNEIIDQ